MNPKVVRSNGVKTISCLPKNLISATYFPYLLYQKVYRQIVDARVLVTLVLLEEQTVNQETGLGKLTSITNLTEETLVVIAEER